LASDPMEPLTEDPSKSWLETEERVTDL
jgi:hypothetical protein